MRNSSHVPGSANSPSGLNRPGSKGDEGTWAIAGVGLLNETTAGIVTLSADDTKSKKISFFMAG